MGNEFVLTATNTGYIVLALCAVAGAILYYAQKLDKKDDSSKKLRKKHDN